MLIFLLVFASNGSLEPLHPSIPVTIWRAGAVGFGFLILWRYIPLMLQVLLANPLLTIFLAYVCLSVLWSFDPGVSWEPVFWSFLMALFGLYVAVRYSLEDMFTVLVYTLILSILLSIVLAIIAPQGAIHGPGSAHAGAWRGIYSHKNQFGIFMALGFVHVLLLGSRWGRWRFLFMGLLFFGALASTSATAVLLCVGSLFVLPLLRLLRIHHTLLLGALLILIPIGLTVIALVATNYGLIAEALGRDATLTGRTELWGESLALIVERPLFGWGLRGAFAPGSPIFNNIIWDGAPYAHNHWIDLTLDLGLVGTLLYILVLVPMIFMAIVYSNREKTLESAFPLIFLIFLHIANFGTESVITMWDFRLVMFVAFGYGLTMVGRVRGGMPFRRPHTPI